MRPHLLPSLSVIAVLAAALVAAPWPEGDVMGRDREIVARLTRGGLQRLDADVDHGVHDAADHTVAADPLAHAPRLAAATAAAADLAALPASGLRLAPPAASRLPAPRRPTALRLTPPSRRPRARGPPAAA